MIYQVKDKTKYIDLLLLADEEMDMINRYIDKGKMFVLDDGGVKGEIVVTEDDGTLEIKNLAVNKSYQRRGYGRQLIEFVCEHFKHNYSCVVVGTGDSPLTLPFYESCGFKRIGIVKDFFTQNYSRPIIEDGVILKDMIILQRELN